MKLFTPTTDAKIDRIQASWFRPSLRDAAWLASIADQVNVDRVPTESNGFAYVSLDAHDSRAPGAALAVPARLFKTAVERIPALATVGAERVALAA